MPDLVEANRDGQQLFFADMFNFPRIKSPVQAIMFNFPRIKSPVQASPAPPEALDAIVPVAHRQLVLFAWPWDLRVGARLGFPEPADQRLADALLRCVDEHGRRYGWSEQHVSSVRRGMRIVLALQDTPGAPIRASEVKRLAQLGLSVPAVTAVLTEAGMFDDDREPAIFAWFRSQVADLPDEIRHELGVWFDVMRNGSSIPPRRIPRKDQTINSQLRTALPALRHWARTHQSLREVTRDEIKAILPASGSSRSLMLQSFRSIFRILKARQLVFANPTARMKARGVDHPAPPPVDLVKLRAALGADDPARAAVAALLAFHAVRVMDLRLLRLTDLHDGRLHIGQQTVLLAEPVRDCLAAYLDHRAKWWPNTINPHLFINRRSALHDRPVNDNWVHDTLGMPPNAVRRDRILDEAFVTGGDLRQLTDMFGVSVATADRFANYAHRAMTAEGAGP